MFAASVATHGPRPCLGARTLLPDGEAGPYEWQTYAEVGARVDAVGTALARARVGAGGRVGVYGVNSPEWMITMQV
jgi:long-chain acyl-CoA synthetase